MISKQTKEVAEKIGEFYLTKNNNDYQKTAEEIRSLRVTEIIAINDFVVIKVGRPGLLIGKRGQNIDALQAATGKKFYIIEVEDNDIESHLIPQSLEEFE